MIYICFLVLTMSFLFLVFFVRARMAELHRRLDETCRDIQVDVRGQWMALLQTEEDRAKLRNQLRDLRVAHAKMQYENAKLRGEIRADGS